MLYDFLDNTYMTTHVYQSSTLHIGAKLVLHHKLYVSGWALQPAVKAMLNSTDSHDRIALCFLENTPVAVAVLSNSGVMAFCRKSERRNGYAGACVRALRSKRMYAEVGILESRHFWDRLGVLTLDPYWGMMPTSDTTFWSKR